MKRDGTLTKREEATVANAMEIMRQWLDLHKDEEPLPYGYWGIQEAHYQLGANFDFMLGE